jgi:light-regulated signal transduction histidine kinase (bacteriophytochrome)
MVADPAQCEKEPIHAPQAIQPHGALLAARQDSLRITHASANLAAILGREAADMLGQDLGAALGTAMRDTVLAALPEGQTADGRVLHSHGQRLPVTGGGAVILTAHRSGDHVCIDIEPDRPEPLAATLTMAQAVLHSFEEACDPRHLARLAVRGLRDLTGYDRVMAYCFAPDGSGEVIAEDLAAGLEPYFGLHYPASDIPAQARRLYLRQRVGAVADANYQPVPLLANPALDDGAPLDLTNSLLRSVSPLHREFMRNMRTAASLTIGLEYEQTLWGMLVCHHESPRIVGPDLRATAAMVGQVVSMLVKRLIKAERLARRRTRQASFRALVDSFATNGVPLEALAAAQEDLLRLMDATGAIVSSGGTVRCIGRTPPPATAGRALARLMVAGSGDILAVDDLARRYPELSACCADGSGALLLPLERGTDDAVLWFRPEQSRVIEWGGNPSNHLRVNPQTGQLHPRSSFAVWRETVRGRSTPWDEGDVSLADELRDAIETEQARRTRAELNEMHRIERLAAQPDRARLDLERSNAELEEFAYAASHDLKAPLRAIEHLAQWIAEDIGPGASAETTTNLQLLRGRVTRLQRLLDGLLAYSRVGHRIDAPAEDVCVPDVVRGIVALQPPPAGFAVECVGEMPVLHTERVPLEVVLRNLINNGIMHHDRASGRIEVAMRLAGGVAEFRVSDDGPGIAPRFHERIFHIFQTLNSRDDRESSGIGLAIVRKKVQIRGGDIRIESAPPIRGSTFVFAWKETAR